MAREPTSRSSGVGPQRSTLAAGGECEQSANMPHTARRHYGRCGRPRSPLVEPKHRLRDTPRHTPDVVVVQAVGGSSPLARPSNNPASAGLFSLAGGALSSPWHVSGTSGRCTGWWLSAARGGGGPSFEACARGRSWVWATGVVAGRGEQANCRRARGWPVAGGDRRHAQRRAGADGPGGSSVVAVNGACRAAHVTALVES